MIYRFRARATAQTQSGGSWFSLPNMVDGDPNALPPATAGGWTTTGGNQTASVDFSAFDDLSALSGMDIGGIWAVARVTTSDSTRFLFMSLTARDGATALHPTVNTTPPGTHIWGDQRAELPVTLSQLQATGFNVRLGTQRTNQGGTFNWSIDHLDLEVEAWPAGQRPTLETHLAALRRLGAVVIWPLTDPPGTDWTYDIVNGRALWSAGTAQWGVPGPFPDATARAHAVTAGWNLHTSDGELAPLNRLIRRTTMTWWQRLPTPTVGGLFYLRVTPVSPPSPWHWMPLWWFTGGWGMDWGFASGDNVISVADPVLQSTRWQFLAAYIDGDTGFGVFYVDGVERMWGWLPPARPIAQEEWRQFIFEQGGELSSVALFDRILTPPEIRELQASAPEVGVTKRWNGSAWQEVAAKGWAGSAWRGAKVWTGSRWQEL